MYSEVSEEVPVRSNIRRLSADTRGGGRGYSRWRSRSLYYMKMKRDGPKPAERLKLTSIKSCLPDS